MLKDPKLSSEEIEYLSNKYDTKNNTTVNYREFISSVIKAFPDNDLKEDPENYTYKNPEYLGTFRSMKKLSPDEEADLKMLLIDMSKYYSKKNIEVLTWFRDFDRNRIGLVTENQFRRSLTEPPLSEEQLDLIVRKYLHPDVKNNVNYLNFFNDVKSNQDNTKSGIQSFESVKNLMPPVNRFFSITFYHSDNNNKFFIQELNLKFYLNIEKWKEFFTREHF